MNAEKLAKLQSQVRIGGKGTPRRKVKKVQKVVVTDEKKLENTLKKLNVQSLGPIEEVNMFKADGSILHFTRPQGFICNLHSSGICSFQYICGKRSWI
jgi:nascent polypeptide-associated complex subunit beta